MPLQIANPAVVAKVERAARRTGLSKTAVVEKGMDRLLAEPSPSTQGTDRLAALLAQIDRIPDRSDAFDAVPWDDAGLPK